MARAAGVTILVSCFTNQHQQAERTDSVSKILSSERARCENLLFKTVDTLSDRLDYSGGVRGSFEGSRGGGSVLTRFLRSRGNPIGVANVLKNQIVKAR